MHSLQSDWRDPAHLIQSLEAQANIITSIVTKAV